MRIRVLYHDHCFDGAASAALFSRFTAEKFYDGADYVYTGMAHKASQLFEDSLFDGDQNAIVDFKYSNNDRLTWWFDHHQSAFLSGADAADYERKKDARRYYFDPTYRSCTEFIAHVAGTRYGYHAPDLAELVHWAGIIDGAVYSSAEEAVAMRAPAMKLTLVIEAVQGSEFVQRVIGLMQRHRLDEIMAQPDVAQTFAPLYERHLRSIQVIGDEGSCSDGTIFFDIADRGIEGYNKFIPYSLFPQATYSVSVSLASFRSKISVGSNPWAPNPPEKNLATICERYGGGGHPRVGAISFERNQVDEARRVAVEILRELRCQTD